MAVLETIRSFIFPSSAASAESVTPAPETTYSIRTLTREQLKEVLRLNLRCFPDGDNYTRYTFEYLLSEPRTLSYRAVTAAGETVAFAFVLANANGAGHLTTIGVAPEHRRRGLGVRLLEHLESSLRQKEMNTLMLEVRVSNFGAQQMYLRQGYAVVQRIERYYNNGEDCLLMMKALNQPFPQ